MSAPLRSSAIQTFAHCAHAWAWLPLSAVWQTLSPPAVLVDDRDKVTMIDFPQMVSVSHLNARELFVRDVECVVRFFERKLNHAVENDPDIRVVR